MGYEVKMRNLFTYKCKMIPSTHTVLHKVVLDEYEDTNICIDTQRVLVDINTDLVADNWQDWKIIRKGNKYLYLERVYAYTAESLLFLATKFYECFKELKSE